MFKIVTPLTVRYIFCNEDGDVEESTLRWLSLNFYVLLMILVSYAFDVYIDFQTHKKITGTHCPMRAELENLASLFYTDRGAFEGLIP